MSEPCFVTSFDLRHGDCLDGMTKIADASIDLVVTSPPYNLGIAYSRYSDRQDRAGYLDWCHEWLTEVRRLLKPDGSLFLNLGAAPSNPLLPHELVLRVRDLFVLQNTIHWIKAISIENDEGVTTSRGHFKPISSPRYLNDCHEYVFHLTPEGKTPIGAAAETPGSFLMKRSSAGKRSGRIRRRSQSSWRKIAFGFTECATISPCSIHFSASEIPPSPLSVAT